MQKIIYTAVVTVKITIIMAVKKQQLQLQVYNNKIEKKRGRVVTMRIIVATIVIQLR